MKAVHITVIVMTPTQSATVKACAPVKQSFISAMECVMPVSLNFIYIYIYNIL